MQNKIIAPKHRILLTHTTMGFDGPEVHALNLYKKLLQTKNIEAVLLVCKNSQLEKKLQELKLPYYRTPCYCFPFKVFWRPFLSSAITKICNRENISIIHTNNAYEVTHVKKDQIHTNTPITIIHTHHSQTPVRKNVMHKADTILYVGNMNHRQHDQSFTHVPHFFDDEKFLTFTPKETKHDFFAKNFNLYIPEDAPIISIVGRFRNTKAYKNHELFLNAIANVIHTHKKYVHVLCVGDGPQKDYYQRLACKLNIDKYVHFLGYSKQIPAILFYSDFNVIASSREGFGIVLLEAAIMKKPSIIAHGTGAADIFVKHMQTGLLFEPDNCQSLTQNITLLLDKPELTKQLGQNVYKTAHTQYTNKHLLNKLLSVYDNTLKA